MPGRFVQGEATGGAHGVLSSERPPKSSDYKHPQANRKFRSKALDDDAECSNHRLKVARAYNMSLQGPRHNSAY